MAVRPVVPAAGGLRGLQRPAADVAARRGPGRAGARRCAQPRQPAGAAAAHHGRPGGPDAVRQPRQPRQHGRRPGRALRHHAERAAGAGGAGPDRPVPVAIQGDLRQQGQLHPQQRHREPLAPAQRAFRPGVRGGLPAAAADLRARAQPAVRRKGRRHAALAAVAAAVAADPDQRQGGPARGGAVGRRGAAAGGRPADRPPPGVAGGQRHAVVGAAGRRLRAVLVRGSGRGQRLWQVFRRQRHDPDGQLGAAGPGGAGAAQPGGRLRQPGAVARRTGHPHPRGHGAGHARPRRPAVDRLRAHGQARRPDSTRWPPGNHRPSAGPRPRRAPGGCGNATRAGSLRRADGAPAGAGGALQRAVAGGGRL